MGIKEGIVKNKEGIIAAILNYMIFYESEKICSEKTTKMSGGEY